MINQESQNFSSEHSFIIVTYFHGQNAEKLKKDKIVTLSFPKCVSFYHLSVPEGLRISKIFFAILHTKILIDNRKGFFLSLSKTKNIKKQTTKAGVFKQTITLL